MTWGSSLQLPGLYGGIILRKLAPTLRCPAPHLPPIGEPLAPSGFFKINVDGAASDDGTNSSIGVIIRDNQGNPIAASSKTLPSPYTAEITEAIALLHGVLLALEMKISHAIFESDAFSIVQALNQGEVGGEIGLILQDIRIFSASFSWCSFQHLKRDGNRVAHELAKAARLSQIWKGVNPSYASGGYMTISAFVVLSLCCNPISV
nr:hypothetical protein CFP56_25554 [Quercus suber]